MPENPSDQPPALLSRFARVHQRVRRRQTALAVIQAAGLAAVLLLLAEALNGIWPWREGAAAWCVALTAGLALADLAWFGLRHLVRRARLTDLALAVERVYPEWMDSLVCAVEVEQKAPEQRGPIERALLETVGERSRGLDLDGPVVPVFLRWRRLLVLALLAGALGALALRTQVLRKGAAGLRETLGGGLPGLVVEPGDRECPIGSDVTIAVDVRRWENRAEIVYRDGEERHRFQMNRESGGRHTFTLYGLAGPVRYRVRTPSLASPWYSLAAFRPPVLLAATLTVTPPAYTGLAPQTFPDVRDAAAPAGSRVALALKVEPGVTAEWRAGASTVPLVATPAGELTGDLAVERPVACALRLRSADGHAADGPAFRIDCTPDLRPAVEVLTPRRDVAMKPDGQVEITARASDDYGLREVAVQYSVSGGERKSVVLARDVHAADPGPALPGTPRRARVAETSVRHVFEAAALGLREGDVIAYCLVATDNREPEGQSGRSEVFFVEVRGVPQPKEGQGAGQQKELDISGLIAELKRLIRLTWDVQGLPAAERDSEIRSLTGGLQDLQVAIRKKAEEVRQMGGDDVAAAVELLESAAANVGTAGDLASRRLLEEALPPQEQALAKLVAMENEMVKNAMRGKSREGKPKPGQQGQGGGQPQETQPTPPASARARLKEMREALEELRRLAARQEEMNREMSQVEDEAARALAERQAGVEADTQSVASRLEKVPEAAQARDETSAAGREMRETARSLGEARAAEARRRGARAQSLLGGAIQSLEGAYRRAAAAEIARLGQAAQQLADAQREGAEASRQLATTPPPAAEAERQQQRQQQLNAAAEALGGEIGQTSAALEETFPEAAQALSQAKSEAEAQNLSGRLARAANALLYKRYDKANQSQVESANILQQLAGGLQQAGRALPTISREELAAALERLQQEQRQAARLEEAAGAPDTPGRLDQLRGQASADVDRLAEGLRDQALRQIGDSLAAPLGSGDVGEDCRRVQQLIGAAAHTVEKVLFAAEMRRRFLLSRQNATPPEKYRRQVEEYFRNLSESP